MDRVAEFLKGRLRGRKVPEDLRRLVELKLDRKPDDAEPVQPLNEIRVLEPGEVHPLEEPIEPAPGDPDADATRANIRALESVLAHVAAVVIDYDGNLWGYWLHPDEPADVRPHIVKFTTEGSIGTVRGENLVEAIVFDWGIDRDVSEVIAYCEKQRIPLSARSYDDLPQISAVVEPSSLHEKLAATFHPYHRRPAWADDAGSVSDEAPIGARSNDPRVGRALARHGLPQDPMPLIRAADEGQGTAVLNAAGCSAIFEFHRETDTEWFLHEMRFSRGGDDAPACTHVPFGFDFSETPEQCRVRFGEPVWKSPLGNMESWRFGRVKLHVMYKDDKPRRVRCFEASV
jgi:hypothetical protein